jgi:hypothetical protein
MGNYVKLPLSGSTDGEGIVVSGTAPTLGPVIHTCVTVGATDVGIDEVWLYAYSTATVAKELTLRFGVTTATGSKFTHTITADDLKGLVLIVPGLPGRNSKIWKASVTADGTINIWGFVNRYIS